MIIEDSMIPQVSSLVKVRNEDFGLLLVSKKTPILALNEDSKVIWECIDGIKTVKQIAELINSYLDGEYEETAEIVKCFIESCHDLRLLEIK